MYKQMFGKEKLEKILRQFPSYVVNLPKQIPKDLRKIVMDIDPRYLAILDIDLDVDEQLKIISSRFLSILLIDNIFPEVQLKAVEKNMLIILYIKNPCDKAIEYVRQKNPQLLECIKIIAGAGPRYVADAEQQEKLNKLTQVERLLMLVQDGTLIRFIQKPSVAEQYASVQQNYLNIVYIEEPDISVQEYLIDRDELYFRIINNISEASQRNAVSTRPHLLKFISNPSEIVQRDAVTTWGFVIKYINNPSNTIRIEAMRETSESIGFIQNPTLMDEMYALGQGASLACFRNPSKKLVQYAVYTNSINANFVPEISDELLLHAIRHREDDTCLGDFLPENLSAKVEKYLIDLDIENIKFIQNPSNELKLKILEKNFHYFFQYFKTVPPELKNLIQAKYPSLKPILNLKYPTQQKKLYHDLVIKPFFPKNFKCAICFAENEYEDYKDLDETYYTITTLPCDHSFHHTCITQWKIKISTCPLCRATL